MRLFDVNFKPGYPIICKFCKKEIREMNAVLYGRKQLDDFLENFGKEGKHLNTDLPIIDVVLFDWGFPNKYFTCPHCGRKMTFALTQRTNSYRLNIDGIGLLLYPFVDKEGKRIHL